MTSLTHASILNREETKYQKEGWLTFKEVHYGGYFYDLVTLNPATKELVFIEVDVAHETSEAKIAFAKKVGEFKIFRPIKKGAISKKIHRIFKCLRNPMRLLMLDLLAEKRLTYTGLISGVNLLASRDAGRFAYHLKLLKKERLIKKEDEFYTLSPLGEKILEFCNELESLL